MEGNETDQLWTPGESLKSVQKRVILKAYKHFKCNQTHTAKGIGISIRSLRYKLKSYRSEK